MSLRYLLFTILIFLAACVPPAPAAQPLPEVQDEPPATPIVVEARVLQAQERYLSPLPTRTVSFEAANAISSCQSSASSDILFSPVLMVSGQFLEVRICYQGRAEDYSAFHVFLDMGAENGFLVHDLRAGLLVENDSLFRYAGQGKDWKWDFIAPVTAFDAADGEVSWSIPLSLLGSSAGKAVFQVVDRNWTSVGLTSSFGFLAGQ